MATVKSFLTQWVDNVAGCVVGAGSIEVTRTDIIHRGDTEEEVEYRRKERMDR